MNTFKNVTGKEVLARLKENRLLIAVIIVSLTVGFCHNTAQAHERDRWELTPPSGQADRQTQRELKRLREAQEDQTIAIQRAERNRSIDHDIDQLQRALREIYQR